MTTQSVSRLPLLLWSSKTSNGPNVALNYQFVLVTCSFAISFCGLLRMLIIHISSFHHFFNLQNSISLTQLDFYGIITQHLEVREKQYDKKAYLDFFTVSLIVKKPFWSLSVYSCIFTIYVSWVIEIFSGAKCYDSSSFRSNGVSSESRQEL